LAELARGHIAPNSAGVRYPNALCGRSSLYSRFHSFPSTRASSRLLNSSAFNSSSGTLLLNDSAYPFSHGVRGPLVWAMQRDARADRYARGLARGSLLPVVPAPLPARRRGELGPCRRMVGADRHDSLRSLWPLAARRFVATPPRRAGHGRPVRNGLPLTQSLNLERNRPLPHPPKCCSADT
jgi:hypothetical protein